MTPPPRESITTYTTLEHFEAGRRDEGYSLLECHLYTGRTHQIRVHMRHTGHPVVGDQLYGRETTAPTMDCAASSSTPGTSRLTIR